MTILWVRTLRIGSHTEHQWLGDKGDSRGAIAPQGLFLWFQHPNTTIIFTKGAATDEFIYPSMHPGPTLHFDSISNASLSAYPPSIPLYWLTTLTVLRKKMGIPVRAAEIAPMEKRLDIHIELLRRDEFREMEPLSDIIKCVSPCLAIACRLLIDLLEKLGSAHPVETYFSGFDYDLGERALGNLTSFDLDLDIFAASIGMTKTSIKTFVQGHETVLDLGGVLIRSCWSRCGGSYYQRLPIRPN
ncbi:hypothetical protein B0H13DRAFT_2563076 [Mycena leptocephala]|nr:hypothetical protein B0H13DRAFT_2563076 [Mycena leptocephala]